MPLQPRELAVLEREVQTNRQLYDMFMSRAKETDLAGDVQASIARVVDAAVPPTLPFKPAKSQIVAVATLLAVLVGALASILMDRLDNTFKGAEAVATIFCFASIRTPFTDDVPKSSPRYMCGSSYGMLSRR